MSRSSPPSSPVTPSKDSNSNLIKSLLANKVNQNIQRQQLLKQKTVTHPSSSVKNATPVQNASNISSGPLTLEACLAIPVSSTPTLSTATRDSIGGASLTTAFSPTATTDTVSNTVTGVTASPVKFRTNSQLGAMLGHCNPPPPLPPPTLTKELMAAQAAVKARLAEQSNSIVPSCTPSVSSGPKLTSTPPLQSHTVSPKLRINGMQRLVPVEIRGGEKIQGNANCSSESRAHVPENHISTPDLSNVNHSVSVISGGLNCESPEPEATLKTVLPSAPKLQGVPITDGNITHSSLEKPVGTTISLRLQNGTQIIASPIPSPGIQQVTHAATVPTSTTATSSNPPSIFKCHELTSAQNSGHNPFANLPPSLQPPQPPKKKGGVLADLLDGKVHKDTLFSMNGIVDRRPGDKKPISPLITNHQNEAIAKTSIVTPVAVATTIPASAPSKNCNISNGDNMVNHSSAAPRTITTTMVVAAAPISSPSLKLSIESDKANARHLGNTNGCGGKMLLVPTGGIMPINNTLRERNDDPTSKTPAQSGSTVAPNIHASGETNAKCTPNISPNARTVVNSRFAVITPPKTEELIGFPRVSMEQLKQLRQQAAGTMRIIAKRPPVDSSDASNDPAKRIRTEDIQMQGARLPVSVSSQSSSTFLTPIAPKPSTIPLCGCITNATSVITTTSAPIASVILVSTPTSVATDASGKATSLVADTSTGVVGIKSEFKWSVLNRSTLVPSSTVIVQKVKTKLASEVDKVAVAGRSPCPTVSSKCIKEEHTPSSSSPSPLAVVGTPALSANVVPPKVVADNDSSNSNMESTNVPAVPPSTVLPQPKLEFLCEWKDCKK